MKYNKIASEGLLKVAFILNSYMSYIYLKI